jgi:hypothetical protein
MKTVRMTLPPGSKPVHDGVGGKHSDNAIVTLPDDVADILITRGCAQPMGADGEIQARAQAKARVDELRMAEQQARSRRAMALHDNLPQEVRELVAEHGDEAAEAYLQHMAQQAEQPDVPTPQQRLNRKQRRMLRQRVEGDDV